ncbi:CLUMA_CG007449, isoform A [Clunio marinus]|uniref:CLUMA_CG007449, isoform A n=1 Tax=Clunio marinus TaxID=568069 RepID=A0A1J1I2D0_9DIPT|nr:CLUMA_CG007449, isoform A [Clunio marinus]
MFLEFQIKMSRFEATNEDNNDNNQNPCCRICFSSHQYLISMPCNCSGSVGYVHKRCFQRWLKSVRNFDTCEICHESYVESTLIPKRSLKKLFMTFFHRPFYGLCKFCVNFTLTAGIGYTLSLKLPVIFNFLNSFDVNQEATIVQGVLWPMLTTIPLFACYCLFIERTTASCHELLLLLNEWRYYNRWIAFQALEDSTENLRNSNIIDSSESIQDNVILSTSSFPE